MLHDVTSFDNNLQMFREPSKPVSLEHLRFMRWLVEHGRLEAPAGRPCGEFAEMAPLVGRRAARRRIAPDSQQPSVHD